MSTTRTSPITADVIRQAIDGIDALCDPMAFCADYSGRGMYGRSCVAVELDSLSSLLTLGASIAYVIANNTSSAEDPFAAASAIDDAISPLSRARIDSLGHGYVVYWPSVTTEADCVSAAAAAIQEAAP